jgi:HD-GYP domain-containing protein (c-di-GMP phosphodiesterase class II)
MALAANQYTEATVLGILNTTEELNHLKDVDAILDKILFEARALANADAGSIFLVEEDRLKFSYVQNDTLFQQDESNAAIYADFSVPISEHSIVGFAAQSGQIVVVDDAYAIPADLPYTFNASYDAQSGYHTQSILTIPLKSFESRLVGVMQLINAKDEHGTIVPFSKASRLYVPLFGNNAAVAVERGLMTRELVLRMMRMAELRDPTETGAHVQRVGAYSAEIYSSYARNQGIDKQEVKRFRDLLRLAAMLHDVGKVGISDLILKKPDKLSEAEFNTMKWHTVHGARLFVHTSSDLDRMCREIALNHHEKWDGSGYPGEVRDLMADEAVMGKPRRGEEIPLGARITALADVFDALASRRAYKEPWPDDKILAIIRQESGKHFDPKIVEAFLQIFEVIQAIRGRYS